MKKLRFLFCAISLCILCVLLFTACTMRLDAPKNFVLDTDTLTLTWKKTAGAESYTIVIGDTELVTRSNSYSLESLEPGTYIIKVCANGDGENAKNSEFIEYSFTREEETGLRYKLINNNTEYQLVGIGTAEGDVVMESVYRGKPVTAIAASALSGNARITSFVVGEHVKTIGKKAFYNSKAMESITIPEGVVSIGESAFQTCTKLKSITLPSTLTEIPKLAFGYCRGLETLNLGENTKTIGEKAFVDCESLKSIILPDSVTSIGVSSFSSCKKAVTLKLSNSLADIAENAFYRCESIVDVTIGTNVKQIGAYAFGNCMAITAIDIPDNVESIDSYAFSYCNNLETVTLGKGLREIGAYAFYETKLYNEAPDVVYIDNWIVDCKNSEITQDTLDSLIKRETVGIAAETFVSCTKIGSVKLPNVKFIGDYAFWGCTLLRGYPDTTFSNELEIIGSDAFVGCLLLDRFNFGTVLTSIGAYAFHGCVRLAEVDLPDTLTSIGTSAFDGTGIYTAASDLVYADNWLVASKEGSGNIVIKDGTVGIADYCFYQKWTGRVEFPSSLKYIGKAAFYECLFVAIQSFPQSLKSIDDYAFYGCTYGTFGDKNYLLTLPEGLEYLGRSAFYQSQVISISIPGSLKKIGDYAFAGCTLLGASEVVVDEAGTTVPGCLILNEGIEHIGTRAFYNCSNLDAVVIPDSVTSLGQRVFNKCYELDSVVIGEGLTEIGDYMFYNCTELESITISDSVIRIGKYAFRGCMKLTDITFGNNVQIIDNFAFMGCKALKNVVLPDSVTTIGNYAFRALTSATSIIIGSNVETIGQHAFYGCSIASIYCEDTELQPYWNERFNSSYRPIFFGVQLSEDRTYVEALTVSAASPDNSDATNGITAPRRAGYQFMGWATTAGGEVVYSAAEVVNAPVGTTLYAVYQEGEEPEEEPEEEGTSDENSSTASEA